MLIAVEGKPGLFRDSVTGEFLNISQWREDDKYDTCALPVGAVGFNTELTYWRDIGNKSLIDCNVKTSRRVPKGEKMALERIGLHVPLAFGNVIPHPADIKRIAENGYLKCQLNGKDIAEGPGIKFASGYGLSGNTVETDEGVLGIGMASTASAAKLTSKQRIDADVDMDAIYTFQRRQWATVAAIGLVATAGANETPTMVAITALRLFFHGMIEAAATQQ